MNKEKDKAIKFLKANGWNIDKETYSSDAEYWTYTKDGFITIDLSEKEMVFICETGDFLHENINLYTLIGVLIFYRQLLMNFSQ